jgi:hypothetical protein
MTDQYRKDITYDSHIQDVCWLIQKLHAEGATHIELQHQKSSLSLVIDFGGPNCD